MRDKIGEVVLVQSRFVLGIVPTFPIIKTEVPIPKGRMDSLTKAQN